jgi:integrase
LFARVDAVPQLLAREAARRDRDEFTALSYRADRIRMETEIVPFFGDYPIGSIDSNLIETFCMHLERRQLSSTTLSLYLMTLRKALKYAVALKLIESVPAIPKIRIRKRSRGSFTPSEYVRILRSARRRVGETLAPDHQEPSRSFWISARYRRIPDELPWAIAFMVNSFIRPSDLRTLRHRHVEIVRGPHTDLRLTLPETEAHDAPIVTLRPAVRLYERMRRLQQQAGLGREDDFLFFPGESDRSYALAVLGWLFRRLLEDLGLRDGPHGHPRTLYSLRHTAITLRLLYGSGIDMLTLARNARTSVDMIERHYASTLTGERNIGMLQSKRTRAIPAGHGLR